MKNRIICFLCMVTAFAVGIDFCLIAEIHRSRETANPRFELLTTDSDASTRSEIYKSSNGTTVYYSETTFPGYVIDFMPISFNMLMTMRIEELEKSGGKLLEKTASKDNMGNETAVRVLMECHKPNGTFIKILRSDSASLQTIDSDSRESAFAFERTLRH